jgi:hypothetical protein
MGGGRKEVRITPVERRIGKIRWILLGERCEMAFIKKAQRLYWVTASVEIELRLGLTSW